MTRREPEAAGIRLWALLVLASLSFQPGPVGAEESVEGGAEEGVVLVRPAVGQPLFDQVVFEAEVAATLTVDRLEFRVDDKVVGDRSEPPWRLEADVGPQNRDRRLEVLAYQGGGVVARDARVAAAVEVNETVDLHLQQIYVTVTDDENRRVLDLEASDFTLLDDGREQKLVTVQSGDIPFTAVVLLDTSESMQREGLRAAIEGARLFVEGMRPLDEAKVVAASDRILRTSPWSARGEDLVRSFDGLEAQGGTSIFDPLFLSLTLLESRLGRRVLVFLGDGWDNHSVLDGEELVETARRLQSTIYWVRLGEQAFDPQIERRRRARRAGSRVVSASDAPVVSSRYERDRSPNLDPLDHLPIPVTSWRSRGRSVDLYLDLEEIVEATGGRIVNVVERGGIAPAFQEILAELREQYALGYYPEPRGAPGSWHEVGVELEDGDLDVRTRDGYVAR